MQSRHVFLLAILVVVFAYMGTQVALAPEPNTLPILPTPNFSRLTAYPVVRVADGDTIVVGDNGKKITVRLVGVDTPETVHPTKPVEHYGKEASLFTSNLLKGEKVYLVSDPQQSKTDRRGRTLAYVYRAPDGLFVNAEIIRQGYGHAYTQIPSKYMQEFKQLEHFARKAEKGLWAPASPVVKPRLGTQPNVNNEDCWDTFYLLKGAIIIANDGQPLGVISKDKYDQSSLMNKYGEYGSKYSSNSIFNKYGNYGSKYSDLSPYNKHSSTPPKIYNPENFIAYLTVNTSLSPRIHPNLLKAWLEADE